MPQVRLREIGEVMEVGTPQRANEYLSLGWILLATFARGDARHGRALWYALGWPRNGGIAPHPTPASLDLSVLDGPGEEAESPSTV